MPILVLWLLLLMVLVEWLLVVMLVLVVWLQWCH
jgi:hypothetical protein